MKELEEIYRKRKQQLLPLIFGFAAFFVLFRVVLPQWSDISDVGSLLSQKKSTVEAKEETLRLLNSTPDQVVDDNYTLITTALPTQKDVVLIFSELSDTAQKSGVKLGGFSVKVGGIYTSDTKNNAVDTGKSIQGIPYLNILVNVTGQVDQMKNFAEEIYRSLPLVEINGINIGKNDARYDINFFFKPVTVRPTNADTTALKAISPVEQKQLDELKTWNSSGTPSQ